MPFSVLAALLAIGGPPVGHMVIGEIEGACGKSFANGSYSYRCSVARFAVRGASREDADHILSRQLERYPTYRIVTRKDCAKGWAVEARGDDPARIGFSCGHDSLDEAVNDALAQCRGRSEPHGKWQDCGVHERKIHRIERTVPMISGAK